MGAEVKLFGRICVYHLVPNGTVGLGDVLGKNVSILACEYVSLSFDSVSFDFSAAMNHVN